MKGDKIFPVAFFLHNRKDAKTHKIFFDWLFKELDIPSQIPFVTDREHSIVNSLLGHKVGANQLFYCTFHIRKNVERWCRMNIKTKKLVDQYTNQVRILLDKTSLADFETATESYILKWDPKFANYFQKTIKADILSNLTKLNATSFAYFQDNPQTSNMIESWHFKLQNRFSKYDRIHMRTDVLCLDLYLICQNQMDERNRSIDNDGGEFTLKPAALQRVQKIQLEHLDLTSNNILAQVKALCEEMKGKVDGADNLSEMHLPRLQLKTIWSLIWVIAIPTLLLTLSNHKRFLK